jgi:hypothetical protein
MVGQAGSTENRARADSIDELINKMEDAIRKDERQRCANALRVMALIMPDALKESDPEVRSNMTPDDLKWLKTIVRQCSDLIRDLPDGEVPDAAYILAAETAQAQETSA